MARYPSDDPGDRDGAPPPEPDGPDTPAEPAAEPPVVPQPERTMAMVCHLAGLAVFLGIPFGNVIGPLIVWLIKKDEMPFVDDQGKESLNFQISVAIAAVCLVVVSFLPPAVCITGPALVALSVLMVIFVVIAALKANDGECYRYPASIRFIK